MRYWFNFKTADGNYIYKESDDMMDIYRIARREFLHDAENWTIFNRYFLTVFEMTGRSSSRAVLRYQGRAFLSPDLEEIMGEMTIKRPGQDSVIQPEIKKQFKLREAWFEEREAYYV